MELWRLINTDTRIAFPIMKNDGTFITGAANLDSEYSILGAHGAATPSFSDCTHEAVEIGTTGIYILDVSAAEINGVATIIQIKTSTASAITQVITIYTNPLDANITQLLGTAMHTPALAGVPYVDVHNWVGSAAPAMTGDAYNRLGAPAGASVSADVAAVKSDTAAILTDTATIDTAGEIAAAVWSADATTYQTQGTFGQAIGDPVADANTIYKAVVTDAAGANIGADIVAVKADTAAILLDTGTDGVVVAAASKTGYALTVTPPTAVQIQAEMEENGASILDTLRDDLADGGRLDLIFDGIAAKTVNLPADPADESSLEAAITAAAGNVSVDEIQASAVADLFNTDSGTTYAAAVSGSAVKEIADNAGGSALTEGGIADAVWNEAQSGHTNAGTFGLYLDAKVSEAGGGSLTAADIADAVWDEAFTTHKTTGTFGTIQGIMANWEITGNQLIIKSVDGLTTLYTFNLTQDGTPTEFNPDKRVAV